MKRTLKAVSAGHIPLEQSCMYALAEWANSRERRLLGLHCGQMLPRDRHLTWASQIMAETKITATDTRFVHLVEF